MENDIVDIVKATPNILGQVYSDLAQPSVKVVGTALGSVFEFSTAFLLPVKLLNEKFKLNFTKRLNEYKEKLEEIPEDKRCEVHPQIGTPIIEKLSYTTNDDIADLFTTLLANASNTDMANTAHPSFVNMIERLSPDEAAIIKYLKGKEVIEYCDFKGNLHEGNRGYNILIKKATLITNYIPFVYPNNINAYFANLISMGVLIDMSGCYLTDETITNQIKTFVHYDQLMEKYVPSTFKSITISRSYLQITDLGKLFITACVKQ